MSREALIVKQIEKIEQELEELKRLISDGERRNISLLGVWEGVDISDEAIEEAKSSLSKGMECHESE